MPTNRTNGAAHSAELTSKPAPVAQATPAPSAAPSAPAVAVPLITRKSAPETPTVATVKPTKPATGKAACAKCGGTGWIIVVSQANPYGKAEPCAACVNFLAKSRLTADEQEHRIDDITTREVDAEGEATVLRFMGKQMLADPFGFSAVFGQPGNGKSLYLTALIAEFCRAGRQAVYFNADEIVTAINPGDAAEIDGVIHVTGNPDARLNYLKTVPILAIDEIDKILWTDWQIQRIGALIEHRHRNAATHITLFSMNQPPWKWRNAGKTEHIAERLQDGRFNRYWPEDKLKFLPVRLQEYQDRIGGDKVRYFAPGLFETRLPSIRQQLRRNA